MPDTVVQNLLEKRSRFLAFVQSRVEDRALAEDILQAAYVRALEKSDTLREEDSAAAWFYSVLRNAVTDHFRHTSTEVHGTKAINPPVRRKGRPGISMLNPACTRFVVTAAGRVYHQSLRGRIRGQI